MGFQQFWIVGLGMHAQDNSVQIGVDFFWKPPKNGGQQAFGLQTRLGRFKNSIVAACNLCAFEVQGQGKVVHGTSSDGDKMYVHGQSSKV